MNEQIYAWKIIINQQTNNEWLETLIDWSSINQSTNQLMNKYVLKKTNVWTKDPTQKGKKEEMKLKTKNAWKETKHTAQCRRRHKRREAAHGVAE